ncbi:hypothetical protein A1L58_03035 [Shewanella baltica]|nr:hypothetical protein A1L58_03035 [Shewanella baltica]
MPKGFSTPLGAAKEIQEGIAVAPLLVGCGVKPRDFDSSRPQAKDGASTVRAKHLKQWHKDT